MNTKLISMICLFVTSLLLASCGSKALNDVEFADAAREVCSTLNTESASLDKLDFASRAAAYRRAADALAGLEITEKSAPQGTGLRSGLAGLADSFDKLGKAIDDAVLKANLNAPVTLMITEDGTVFAYTGSILNLTRLDIEPAIVSDLKATQARVREAAISLKLEECAIEWLQK
jgi:hypothetical protein